MKAEQSMYAGAERKIFHRAQRLRSRPTEAEAALWEYLRTKPLGCKFRRQHIFSNYVLDFYCHKVKLCIEVDGLVHNDPYVKKYDLKREEEIIRQGLVIMRFTNEEVLLKKESVIDKIECYLRNKTSQNDSAPQGQGNEIDPGLPDADEMKD